MQFVTIISTGRKFFTTAALLILLTAAGSVPAQTTIAYDVAGNYTSTGFTGNQGFGFGDWTLIGGKYISSDATPYFAITNKTANASSTAVRSFNSSLSVGQTFSVQLMMNNLDTSANINTFQLLDGSGNMLFSYWHHGGDFADGHYTDAGVTDGAAVGFAYDFQKMDSFAFTLTTSTNYTFVDLSTGASINGTISGTISQVKFLRANQSSSTPSNGQDFKFNTLAITTPSLPTGESSLAYEGFNYPPGAVASQNGGFGWGGVWTNVAGNAMYFDLGNLLGESNAPADYDAYSSGNHLRGYGGSRVGRLLDCATNGVFAQNGYLNANGDIGAAGKTIYVSFLEQPALTSKFYEFEFHRNDYGDPGRIAGIGNDTTTTDVNFRAPGGGFTSLGAGDTAVDFYVVRIDFHGGNDDVRIYRNPTSLTEPGIPTLTKLGAGDMSFDRLCVGAWGNFAAIDEIRIGTAWTNVIGLASAVAGSVQSVTITNSTMIGQGIAEFVPDGFDLDQTPSMSLMSEPVSTGPLTSDWTLVPRFTLVNSNACASLNVPDGTSLYGGGEVAGPLLRNGQTIEIWNTDTAGWSTDNLRRMYQAHPWVLGVRPDGTAFGVLFDSSYKATLNTGTNRIVFETLGPLFRVFIIDRASPQAVLEGLAELTGTMSMPPEWALGYHQCRFSYYPASQVQAIATGFLTNQIPCDTLWMDIGYMKNNRDFTIDPNFGSMSSLTAWLHNNGFHAVNILDPAIAVDSSYSVYQSGNTNNLWVQTADGSQYQGVSTPGASVWPDFTMPAARSWWSGLCQNFLTNGMDGLWIDMDEPSANNALTALNTMPYDNWHRGGGDLPDGSHLEYHNAYGLLESLATYQGELAAHPDRRPFVLTRASFIGGQRYAATWTGDNVSSTNNMLVSIPMSLTLGLSGQPFSGPDLGGFIGTATADLWGNWVGFGAFFPFCRGHAIAGSNQKEPWAFGPDVENAARIALDRRYRLLPYIYTLFYNSSQTGIPVMQPVFFADTTDLSLRGEQQAFMLGSDLLVIPSWAQNPALPGGIWQPLSLVPGDSGQYQAQLKIRGGAILPIGAVVQNTAQNSFDPLTLIVCLDANGHASGSLYRDAGDGWDFLSGDYCIQTFTAQQTGNSVLVQLSNQQGNYSVANTPVNVEVITSDGTFYASGSISSGINVSVDPQSGRAQMAFDAYNAAFYAVIDAGKAYYTVNETNSASGATYFWEQAEEIEGAIDAYERNPNPNYLSIVTNLLNGFSSDNETSWSGNIYNDDIMWACIAYLRGYQISGVTQFRTIAKSNFDLVYARGWDSLFGGGLYWTTAKAQKNSAVNGPAAIAAYLLYQTLDDSSYLTKAQNLYNWEKSVLYNPTNGAVYDNIATNGTIQTFSTTYDQGTFVGAADFLGDITNAMLASTFTMNNMGDPNGSGYNILFEYGLNNNNSGFNGIGIRWIAKFMKNRNFQYLYLPWLQANADAAWNVRRDSDNLSWCQWLHQTSTVSNLLSWDCISSMVALQDVPVTSNSTAPVFVVQPADQVTASGNTVGLNAYATNGQPITYQWYHENNPISGATSTSLVLVSVGAADAGNYWVVASNSVASAFSQVANIYLIGNTNGILAQDSATNYNPIIGFTGNQGFGFGSWALNTIGGGSYIGGGTPLLFGLWNNAANGQSTAFRSFNMPLAVGASFWVQLQMNTLDTGNKNGFSLLDADGNMLFSYWHQGSDNSNGHYTDANITNGTAFGFAYDFGQSDSFKFTLNSATDYTFTDLTTAKSFSGKLSGAAIGGVMFFRSNGSSTPADDQDYRFSNLAVTIGPVTPSPSPIAVEKKSQGWSFSFPVAPGYSYRVQHATNLAGPWTDIGTLIGPQTGTAEFIDTNAPAPQSFYRTVSP